MTKIILSAALISLSSCQSFKPSLLRQPSVAGPDVKIIEMNSQPAIGRLIFKNEFRCSGTLIGKKIFLTASHCVDNIEKDDYVIDFPNSSVEQRKFGATEVNVPDRFSYNTPLDEGDDVAIVMLKDNPNIKPLKIYDQNFDAVKFPLQGFIFGYGKTNDHEPSEILLRGEMKFVGLRDHLNFGLSKGATLLYRPSPNYIRGGDSGGPMTVQVSDEYFVVGVTSGPAGSEPDVDRNFPYVGPDSHWLPKKLVDLRNNNSKSIRSKYFGISSDRFIQPEYYDSTLLPLVSFWNVEFSDSNRTAQCRIIGQFSSGSFYEKSKIQSDSTFIRQDVPCSRGRKDPLRIELDELNSYLKKAPVYDGFLLTTNDGKTYSELSKTNLIHLVFSMEVDGVASILRQVHCGYERKENGTFGKINIFFGHNCYHIRE
ncbi:MAG: trypsin-like serine protease [Bdellovibrionota bacterium]